MMTVVIRCGTSNSALAWDRMCRLVALVACALLNVACIERDPEYLGPAGARTGGSTTTSGDELAEEDSSTGGGSTGGTTGEPVGATTGGTTGEPTTTTDDTSESGAVCGEAPDPEGVCPAGCADCDGGVCLIPCIGGACVGETVSCPSGWPCRFTCQGNGCNGATIECPDAHACDVTCQGNACTDLQVQCGSGPCTLRCGNSNVCSTAILYCGSNDSVAECLNGGSVTIVADGAAGCACSKRGCD